MSFRITFSALKRNVKMKPVAAIQKELNTHTRQFCIDVLSELAPYPPPIEEGDYQRTYRLLKAWRIRDISEGDGIRWSLTNPVRDRYGRHYSGFVHGTNQTWFHADNGWRNITDVMQSIGGRGRFQKGVQDIISKGLVIS